jgi:hypothetical protein
MADSPNYYCGGCNCQLPNGNRIQIVSSVSPGWAIVARAQFGDNATPTGGEPEQFVLRADATPLGTVHRQWDADLSDGFDTMPQLAVFELLQDGRSKWTVGGQEIPCPTFTFGTVNRLVLRARCSVSDANAGAIWSAVEVVSQNAAGGSAEDAIPDECAPDASTIRFTHPEFHDGGLHVFVPDQCLEIVPGVGACTGMTVKANVRLYCQRPNCAPGAAGLLVDVFAYCQQPTFLP